jgi:HlyD family secretion protein
MTEIVTRSPYDLAASAAAPDLSSADDPRKEIRFGLIVAVVFFVGFLGWAAFAPLEAAAYAPGQLTVSGQRQTVQHREGGVISEILVKEGSRVQRGQVLIRLVGADVRAQERALSAQAIGLLAQRARLNAEQAGESSIKPPPEFASLPPEDRPAAIQALRIQGNQLRTRAAVLNAQRGALGERTGQAVNQGQGYGKQLTAVDQQIRLIDEEIVGMREAAEKGFVSKNRLRALERAKADLEGQRGQIAATIQQSRGQASETQLESLQAQSTYFERIASELREVNASLGDILPRLSAARDQLARTEIRSPAEGTVVGLAVFTPGGVIQAGQKLMDVVPDRAPLTVEAKISLGDGDDVRTGQDARVRFETFHERSLPALEGKVVRISADALTDEQTGVSFYTAEVIIPPEEMNKLTDLRGSDVLRAGLPVTVTIPLRDRTALQYALEPLTGSLRRSFQEN